MHFLIVGNMGYIGPVVAAHLRARFPDAKLTGFDSGYFAGCLIEPREFPETVLDRQIFGDVRRFPRELLAGVDAVVQLAAISNDPMGKAFESVTEDINSRCAVQIAEWARAAGASAFVFASSCSVYGAGGAEAKTEDSSLNPLTAYSRSKISAEEGLHPLARGDFAVTCLRFATACGWSPRLRLDLVLNDFVASALATGKIGILSDGTPWRPLIHVRDMARAIEWSGRRSVGEGGEFLTVNAGSNLWNYQVVELAEGVRRELGGVELTINKDAAPDKRSYRVNFDRFAQLAPSHQPQVTLAETVRELAAGLKAVGFSDPRFRESNFIRLKVLSDAKTSGRVDADLFWKL